MHIKDGLKGWCDSSPIGQRTRSRVCQNKVLRCKNGKEEWDLDDYERWESKERKEVKIVKKNNGIKVVPLLHYQCQNQKSWNCHLFLKLLIP